LNVVAFLESLETSGNIWKVSWKLPETSEQIAGNGNFQPVTAVNPIQHKDCQLSPATTKSHYAGLNKSVWFLHFRNRTGKKQVTFSMLRFCQS